MCCVCFDKSTHLYHLLNNLIICFYTASSFAARGIPGNEFVFGAGAVDLERALNPGLVYEESELNFRRYFDGKIEIFGLNLPTFAAGFPHTFKCSEKKFARKLKNVGNDDATYKFEIKFFNKSPSDNVTITADPDQLIFKPGEIKEFVLKVKIYPRPHASVSALVKWVPTSGKRCCVSSPLLLYHHSEFDRKVDYVKDTK